MKFCSKCGNSNADEALFCSSCGTPLNQAPAAPAAPEVPHAPEVPKAAPEMPVAPPEAPQPVYTAPTYTAPAYDSPASAAPITPAAEQKNPATLWLILNIVATVVCCPGSFVFSVIGIILAGMGMSSFNKGDVEDAKKKSKTSMIMFIIGAALGLITAIVIGVIWLVALNS